MFMELFVIWVSYSFVAGTALPFIFFPGVPAWEPAKKIIPFLHFGNISLVALIWYTAAGLVGAALINLLARRKKTAALLACCAAFVAASANYYRVVDITSPSHITNFYDAAFFDKTVVRGTIIADPDTRDGFTNIDIKPNSIIPDPVSRPDEVIKLDGKTGLLRAKLYPTIGDYYYSLSYGDFVEITTSINEPMRLKNPAGFDYAAYLRARNVYATARPIRNPEDVKYLGTGNIPWLWRIALGLKKEILLTIRKTMPYPESAFLGGVTLGLRGGVPGKMKSDFQATGVAHVLAVSGLHVGFVAVMLIMMGRVLKLPSKFSFIFVVFGLIIFTLITGASPATRRAAIMFSMMEFFRSVAKMSLGHSTALTIPLTALIILAFDPLKLPDGSFVLSFMAVWSLAMISGPVESVFKFIGRGWIFAVSIALTLSSTVLVVVSPQFFSDTRTVFAYLAVFAALFVLAYFRERTSPLTSLNIEYLPKWFTGFLYAQFAIQIGMMYPLSAVYFQRFPIAGMYANFIAIPLIAFIVQYGLLAGLANLFFSSIGLPGAGLSLALWINAFNWLCCRLFLGMANFFAGLFPYPYISMPTSTQLIIYYSAVIFFVFLKPLTFQAQMLIMRLRDVFDERELKRRVIPAVVAVAVILTAGIVALNASKKDYLRVTFFDVSFGNSVLVETPDGKILIFDTGQGGGQWNSGSSVIAPTFAKYKIGRVNWMVFSSLKSNNIGGTPHLLNYWPVDKIILPYDPARIPYGASYHEFIASLGDWKLMGDPRGSESTSLYLSWYELIKSVNAKKIPHVEAKAGDIIYEKKIGGKNFRAEVVAAPASSSVAGAATVLKITYGKNSVLLAPQSDRFAQWELTDLGREKLASDVVLLPRNGNPSTLTDEFLEMTSPKYAVVQYGYAPRAVRTQDYFYDSDLVRTEEKISSLGAELFRTDRHGAVTVTSDGETISVDHVLKR